MVNNISLYRDEIGTVTIHSDRSGTFNLRGEIVAVQSDAESPLHPAPMPHHPCRTTAPLENGVVPSNIIKMETRRTSHDWSAVNGQTGWIDELGLNATHHKKKKTLKDYNGAPPKILGESPVRKEGTSAGSDPARHGTTHTPPAKESEPRARRESHPTTTTLALPTSILSCRFFTHGRLWRVSFLSLSLSLPFI